VLHLPGQVGLLLGRELPGPLFPDLEVEADQVALEAEETRHVRRGTAFEAVGEVREGEEGRACVIEDHEATGALRSIVSLKLAGSSETFAISRPAALTKARFSYFHPVRRIQQLR